MKTGTKETREREQRKLPQSFTQFLLKINTQFFFYFFFKWLSAASFFPQAVTSQTGMARVAKVSNNICGEPNYFCSPFVQSKPTWLVLRRSHLEHTHTHKSASFIWPEKLNEACMWTHISRFSSQIASLGSVSPPLRLYYKWPVWRPQPHTHILALSSLKRASLRLCYKWPAWWPQPHLCPALPKEGHTEALLQRASLRPHVGPVLPKEGHTHWGWHEPLAKTRQRHSKDMVMTQQRQPTHHTLDSHISAEQSFRIFVKIQAWLKYQIKLHFV